MPVGLNSPTESEFHISYFILLSCPTENLKAHWIVPMPVYIYAILLKIKKSRAVMLHTCVTKLTAVSTIQVGMLSVHVSFVSLLAQP